MDLNKKGIKVIEVHEGAGKSKVECNNLNGVDSFTVTLDNSGGGATTSFRIFDGNGLVADIDGAATAPTSGTVSPSVIASTTIDRPIVISGFNYQTSSTVNQFSQTINFKKANIDGRIITLPNIVAKAKRNTQFQTLLLTIDQPVSIDGNTAMDVDVIAAEIVDLTFFVEGFKGCGC
jgi:hypothetical protein